MTYPDNTKDITYHTTYYFKSWTIDSFIFETSKKCI